MPRMPRMPRDVVRSAILPKEKKKELSCLGLIKFPECDRCGQITAATESRTRDPKICNLMLYQLSYHRVQNALYIPRIMLYILLPPQFWPEISRPLVSRGNFQKSPIISVRLYSVVFHRSTFLQVVNWSCQHSRIEDDASGPHLRDRARSCAGSTPSSRVKRPTAEELGAPQHQTTERGPRGDIEETPGASARRG